MSHLLELLQLFYCGFDVASLVYCRFHFLLDDKLHAGLPDYPAM